MTEAASLPARSSTRAWLIWGLGALGFAFAYFHRVAPSVMVSDLMRDLATTGAVLGNLAAIYFYVYAGLQIPIGVLLDRWGPRRILAIALGSAAIGSALFALADSLGQAYFGRFLVGMGSAATFIGTMQLAGRWFPPNRFALLSGLTMMIAMVGAVGAQAPLAAVIGAMGWRPTMLAASLFAAALAAAIWLVVRDDPAGRRPSAGTGGSAHLLADLGSVVRNLQTWIVALHCGAAAAPIFAYAALWGVPHLMQAYGLERPAAAGSVSLLLVGWAVGSPLFGWLSDAIGRRKLPMAATAAFNLAAWIVLLYLPGLPLAGAWVLLFAIGVACGGAVVSYAAAREQVPLRLSGTATAFVNTAAVGSGAVLQPIVGLLLDANWDGTMVSGAPVYSLAAFSTAFLTIPLSMTTALLAALLTRETFCRPPAS